MKTGMNWLELRHPGMPRTGQPRETGRRWRPVRTWNDLYVQAGTLVEEPGGTPHRGLPGAGWTRSKGLDRASAAGRCCPAHGEVVDGLVVAKLQRRRDGGLCLCGVIPFFPRCGLGEVGRGHPCRVSGGPLDQFDSVTIGVGDPGRPEVFGAIGRGRWLDLHSSRRELGNDRAHGLDLDDDVVETTRADDTSAWIVDELDRHEVVIRELEHREASELGLRHVSEHLVPEVPVEGERAFQVRNLKADVQCPHRESLSFEPCRIYEHTI
jgi:hypothetical protein